MNFEITPENEIICYLDGNIIARSTDLYDREDPDFWTSIDINNVIYDINIYFEQEFNENTTPEGLSLYPLIPKYNEKDGHYYEIDFNNFVVYPLEIKEEPLIYLIGEY